MHSFIHVSCSLWFIVLISFFGSRRSPVVLMWCVCRIVCELCSPGLLLELRGKKLICVCFSFFSLSFFLFNKRDLFVLVRQHSRTIHTLLTKSVLSFYHQKIKNFKRLFHIGVFCSSNLRAAHWKGWITPLLHFAHPCTGSCPQTCCTSLFTDWLSLDLNFPSFLAILKGDTAA